MTETMYFNNYGYIQHKFEEEQLKPIRDEISDIMLDFNKYEQFKYNENLAGNIRKEYSLNDSKEYISELLMPYVLFYLKEFNFMSSLNYNRNHSPFYLNSVWVNFQKKHEFNPPHTHGGFMSFVLYLKVPYLIEDEMLKGPGKESNYNSSGFFSFHYTNSLGELQNHRIDTDETYENCMIMFPSKMMHSVSPFYTSDEYRISVSGNFVFDNKV